MMKFLLLTLVYFIFISIQPLRAYNGGYSPGYEPYSDKPNHTDTVQITDKQKSRCWQRSSIKLFIQ
ncbi:MAG: hypothetical protein ABRQ39_15580 [Candidatus Eremiobacterota bacterium]